MCPKAFLKAILVLHEAVAQIRESLTFLPKKSIWGVEMGGGSMVNELAFQCEAMSRNPYATASTKHSPAALLIVILGDTRDVCNHCD